ncbi:hypothetical protein G9H61_04600 [Aquirufa ecclesiirivi]|uniref:MFS transporter n=1 Tax=Aquirufa ecclesiirivi TaxID=2715124 RepID=A0ABT4JEL3_9BACT|nr:DUF5690 family protein [Aquirufa ecclesiirivi]MCZ2474711.1 hypothetical protein [Aquirufa ecclesiirivi]MDF0692903.1 DUF5690 family protein [Aquirufa ecclesiirivi]
MIFPSSSRSEKNSFISQWFTHPLWSMVAAFGCYFCVYGFRKPFTAGLYEEQFWFGIPWKSVLISSQIAGYMLSKCGGIFFVSSIAWSKRIQAIVLSVFIAELALLGFGLAPRPWSILFLVINGLPLGMIFGYIQGFLEGKKNTELFIASLGASFILADGVSKSVGKFLLNTGVSETWMPCTAGLLFSLPFLFFVWMLQQIPKPTKEDMADRSERTPMSSLDRNRIIKSLGPGILGISLLYLFASLLRGIRSDFAPEIWEYLGFQSIPSLFTQTEIWVTVGILMINGSLVFIKNNVRAFFLSMGIIMLGFILLIISGTLGLHYLNPFWLIVLTGFGIYLPYLTITTSIFERMLAISKHKANIGFLMYIVDSTGYVGYNLLLLCSGFIFPQWNLAHLFFEWIILLGIAGIGISLSCVFYFTKKLIQ